MSTDDKTIRSDRSLSGLYKLLQEAEAVNPSAAVASAAMAVLRRDVAQPLRAKIELATEWLADVEAAFSGAVATTEDRAELLTRCDGARRELRRAMSELNFGGLVWSEALASCESAARRLRQSLAEVVAVVPDVQAVSESLPSNGSADRDEVGSFFRQPTVPRFPMPLAPTEPVIPPRGGRFRVPKATPVELRDRALSHEYLISLNSRIERVMARPNIELGDAGDRAPSAAQVVFLELEAPGKSQ